jgi:hypothetical protein
VVRDVNDGELPVIGGDKGVADDTRRRTPNPEMVSRCPIVVSRRGERRLETRRAGVSLGGDACFDLLRIRKRGKYQQMR